jgi:alginate O-acetyltransferase complex protein AlgI
MPFSTLLFVCGFLPIFVVVYLATPRGAKNVVLLLLSLAFYVWGAPAFLPIILVLGVADYQLSKVIARHRGTRTGRLLVGSGVGVHLATLAYFKYANFFVAESNAILQHLGLAPIVWTSVVLPIGVSFLSFEEISYLVDTYRGDAEPARKQTDYLLFLMLFPHSIAGPIFRWKDLAAQLRGRTSSADDVREGLGRFVVGLAKKVLVANPVALTANAVFALPLEQLTTGVAWLGTLAYAVEIYFDFSGYSDMAIGLGRIAGFRFKENFNMPYVSRSITEFWRRWHISLSSWFRDYVYIPLGGNRGPRWRTHLNVFTVFALSGFWHGANWTFLLWGAYHGTWQLIERIPAYGRAWARLPKAVQVALTFAIAITGWVFFRAEGMGRAWAMLRVMYAGPLASAGFQVARETLLNGRAMAMLVVGMSLALAPTIRAIGARYGDRAYYPSRLVQWSAVPALLVLCVSYMANSKFSPLIYFKF